MARIEERPSPDDDARLDELGPDAWAYARRDLGHDPMPGIRIAPAFAQHDVPIARCARVAVAALQPLVLDRDDEALDLGCRRHVSPGVRAEHPREPEDLVARRHRDAILQPVERSLR